MKTTRRHLLPVVLLMVVGALAASAGPLGVMKAEWPQRYGQAAVHGPLVPPLDVHVLAPPPAAFWDSPFTLRGGVGPPNRITATHQARHKVALHAGEAAPGPWWVAPPISPPLPPAGLPIAVTFAGASGRRNHGHIDYFNEILVALWRNIPPGGPTILRYAYASTGVHDPVGCATRNAALTSESAVPPNSSESFGAASLAIDMNDRTFVLSVTATGISASDLLTAQLHVGPPGAPGPAILDLGPGALWENLEGEGIGRVLGDQVQFPQEFVDALLAGETYIVLYTMQYPQGEIRGQLVAAPEVCAGDSNCDGAVNWRDIDYFVAAMNDNESSWAAMFATGAPPCPFANNDVNGDTYVNWRDIDPLIALMNTPCP